MQPGTPLFPEQASTVAARVDNLYFFLIATSLFFAVLVTVLVIVFAIKYRRRHADEVGAPIHGSLALELVWTGVPFLIAMVMFVWGASVFFAIVRVPDETLDIYAVGKQWMWKFQHRGGQREINELHVPLNTPVRIILTSEDVLHDLYLPAFRVKMDAIPGRYTQLWFTATKPGTYHLFCAEYCGTKHSGMVGSVIVIEPDEYQAWLSGGAAEGTLAQQGEKLFQELACHTCHAAGAGQRGPELTGVFGSVVKLASGETVTANADYIRESILTPAAKVVAGFQPIMPPYQGQVSEEQLLALTEYIRSLSGGSAPESGASTPPQGTAAPQGTGPNR
ncbi:MAG TPA: cytochrome c oxidase subunit II [Vicinamibacterales bacterium]|nr:cytochrome c oxidase subunit II [Vicinamibacterales bacterium]